MKNREKGREGGGDEAWGATPTWWVGKRDTAGRPLQAATIPRNVSLFRLNQSHLRLITFARTCAPFFIYTTSAQLRMPPSDLCPVVVHRPEAPLRHPRLLSELRIAISVRFGCFQCLSYHADVASTMAASEYTHRACDIVASSRKRRLWSV